MLWLQDIVESTLVLSFFINLKIDMVDFVYPHKVVARRNRFSVFSNTWNGDELEGRAKSGRLKFQFSQMKEIKINKRFLNCSHFKEESIKERTIYCNWQRFFFKKSWKKKAEWWSNTPQWFQREKCSLEFVPQKKNHQRLT